jgi:hypothetical protein
MEASHVFYSPFVIPIVAIVGAFAYAIIQTLAKSRVRELEVRERIAMIERGLVPPPEVDPRGFDRAMNLLERRGTGRHRRAGITLMGVGFGLMVMIGFAGGEPGAAIGVGGFLVIMGAAFLVNSLFENPVDRPLGGPGTFTSAPPPPPRPVDPVRHD